MLCEIFGLIFAIFSHCASSISASILYVLIEFSGEFDVIFQSWFGATHICGGYVVVYLNKSLKKSLFWYKKGWCLYAKETVLNLQVII